MNSTCKRKSIAVWDILLIYLEGNLEIRFTLTEMKNVLQGLKSRAMIVEYSMEFQVFSP
jgi:hypothetical protein